MLDELPVVVVAKHSEELEKAFESGARAVRVDWDIDEEESEWLAEDLWLYGSLERLSFSHALPASFNDLVVAVRSNLSLSRVDLAVGDPHRPAIDQALTASAEEVAALTALVPGLGLVTRLLGDDERSKRGAAWNTQFVSLLVGEESAVPEYVKASVLTTVSRMATGADDREGLALYSSFAQRALSGGAASLANVGLLACKVGMVEVLLSEPLRAWDANRVVGGLKRTPLWIACHSGRKDVVELLLPRAGAGKDKADKNGSTPLYIASQTGHTDVVELLLRAGAARDKAQKECRTPLYTASANGHKDVVELLLRAGADKDKAEKGGATPLFIASGRGHKDVVELLLRAGADKDKADDEGGTPIWEASGGGHKDVVEMLLRAGADKDKATSNGCTPLALACMNGHKGVVEMLLQAGADKDKAEGDCISPLSLASQFGHKDLCCGPGLIRRRPIGMV